MMEADTYAWELRQITATGIYTESEISAYFHPRKQVIGEEVQRASSTIQ